ncbi:MAG: AAA family ATPase [Chloroflexi bacterium]|nr:AAA family ATPase [Chloroflexota bacterium]
MADETLGGGAHALDADAPTNFVGRREELALLNRFLVDALAGQPRAVLIQGDPGVGKTRLVEEFLGTGFMRASGAQVLVGRCDADLRTPYLPIRQAMSSLLADPGAGTVEATLRTLLESGPAPANTAESGDLYLTAAQCVIEASRAHTLVLVIDDLHWADEPTMELLTYLATTLGTTSRSEPVHILLIATLREGRRDQATRTLRRRLARIQREGMTRTLALGGLRAAEARALLGELGAAIPDGRPLSAVLEASHGNPLFLREVARAQAGGPGRDHTSSPRVPGDLDEAIEGWLAELPTELRELLSIASVIGDHFTADVLQHVTGHAFAAFDDATHRARGRGRAAAQPAASNATRSLLDQAVDAGLLEEHEATYRFVHPFVREKLAAGHVTPELRRRRHQWVAASLDAMSDGDGVDRTSEIAQHLLLAGSSADVALVNRVAEAAGDRAWAVSAWAEADDCFELALEAGQADHSPDRRAQLLSKAGRAAIRRGRVARALECFGEARGLAEAAGDVDGVGLLLARETAIHTEYEADEDGLRAASDALQEYLRRAKPAPDVRAQVLQSRAHALRVLGELDGARRAAREAWKLAEASGDPTAATLAADALAITHLTRLEPAEALRWTEISQQWAGPGVDAIYRAYPPSRLPLILWMQGQLEAASNAAEQGQQAVLAANAGAIESVLFACGAGVAAARGEFEVAERFGRDALLLEDASSFRLGAHLASPVLAYVRAVSGDRSGARAALSRWSRGGGQAVNWEYEVLLGLESGDLAGAIALRDAERTHADHRWGATMMDLGHLAAAAEIAITLGDSELRGYHLDTITAVLERGIYWPGGWPSFLPRLQGSLALALGELDRAEASLTSALALAAAQGALPELARTHLALAHLLLARGSTGQRAQLEAHLAEAIRGFAALGMTPGLNRAIAVAKGLSAAVPTVAARAPGLPGGLTARQVEILRAISHGKTNGEIADELVLSIATVKRHIANIFNRLGLSNRAAAATYAVQQGLDE